VFIISQATDESKHMTQLEQFILSLTVTENNTADHRTLEMVSTLLSSSNYGVICQWNLKGRQESPVNLVQRVLPLMMDGVVLLKKNVREVKA
jgi:hypothetical protein